MSQDVFQGFVNTELPKRISTNDTPTEVTEGLIPVSTGIGLGTTFKKVEDLGFGRPLEVRLISVKNVPVEGYKAELPTNIDPTNIIKPIMVNLEHGLTVEVIEFSVAGNQIVLDPQDFVEIEESINTVTFKYVIIEDVKQFEIVNLYNVQVPQNLLVPLEEPVYNKMFFNNAILHLEDGSVVDITEIKTLVDDPKMIDLSGIDLNSIDQAVIGLSLSYLTTKTFTS